MRVAVPGSGAGIGGPARNVREVTYNGQEIYLCGIDFSLYDVQVGDVASCTTGGRRHHAILGLKQSAHYIEYCCPADRFRLNLSSVYQ